MEGGGFFTRRFAEAFGGAPGGGGEGITFARVFHNFDQGAHGGRLARARPAR